MWNAFKILSFLLLMTTTAAWPLANISQGPIILIVNILMVVVFSFLPLKFNFNLKLGLTALSVLGLMLWSLHINGPVYAFITLLQFLPIILLIQLPYEYLKDLLYFTIKLYAILLIPSILIYWILFFAPLPSFGTFVHPGYVPYNNYIFYIQTTWDNGIFTRFNGFLLEPGHQALIGTFLTIASRFRYRENRWLIVLGICIIFSFSLAGYLLYFTGWILLKINTPLKAIAAAVFTTLAIVAVISYGQGDNAVNKLILERLERDEQQGIKGNNRFTGNTDFVYDQTLKNGKGWTGVQNETNMDLVEGAGYKIYVIMNGFIGIILSFLFYLAVIPSNPDYKYTLSFLIVIILCFIQRAAPEVYLWLYSYITGIYVAKYDKERMAQETN